MSEMLLFAQVPRFYAEVERSGHPEWRDRPIIVGGNPRKRGLVQSASADALAAGVVPGTPVLEALERCPTARAVRTDMRRYREVSSRLRAHFRGSAERVELAGLDAAYLETGSGDPRALAKVLLERVSGSLHLPLRLGIAPVKFVARLAAEEAADCEIRTVEASQVARFLELLPVNRLPGVGPRTEERLADLSATTIGDVARLDPGLLAERLGNHGLAIHEASLGRGERHLRAAPHARSVSQEATLETPEGDRAQLHERLMELARGVAQGLALEGLDARRIALKIRYLEGDTVTRTRTLDVPVATSTEIGEVAEVLLARTEAGLRSVRLLGLAATDLARGRGDERQLRLFG